MKRPCITMLIALAAAPAAAQQPRITMTAKVSPDRIYLGDATVLQVELSGAADAAPPTLPDIPDCDVQFHGGAQSMTSFSMRSNGRQVESSSTVTYTYTLVPRRAGRFIIPPITGTYGGRDYKTRPVGFEVIDAKPQDYVFIEVTTAQEQCWIEVPFDVEIAVWLRRPVYRGRSVDVDPIFPGEPPALEIPWLDTVEGCETEPMIDYLRRFLQNSGAGFSINALARRTGFFMDRETALFSFPRRAEKRIGHDGAEHDYYVYRIRKQYLPLTPGPLSFGPVRFKGMVPVELSSTSRVSRTEEVLAFSRPLIVDVRPVPTAGRPESYTGAVGRIELDVKAKPTAVNVGDPITLTVRVSGDARLDSVGPPQLLASADLTRDFKVPQDVLGGVIEGSSKVFTQSIRAAHENVREIPPIEMSYFDPKKGTFETVRSRAIPIEVKRGSRVELSDVIGFGGETGPTTLTALSDGMLANYTDVDALLRTPRFDPSAALAWLLAAPLLCLVLRLVKTRRDRLAGNRALTRRRAALRHARHRLSAAGNGTDARAAVEALAAALLGYMADRLNRPDGAMTREEAVAALRAAGVAPEQIDRFDQLLETCELSQYAGVGQTGAELVATGRACLEELESCRF